MRSVEKFFDVTNQSAAALNRKVIEITLRNVNSGLDLAKSLAGARTPFEVVMLVGNYWRKQFDDLRIQAEEVHNRLLGRSAAKPASTEPMPDPRFQAPAPKSLTRLAEGRGPNAQECATQSPEQNSDAQKAEVSPVAAPTAGPEVRAQDKKQLRSRTPAKRPTRLQRAKSTSRDPAQKPRDRKPKAAKTTVAKTTVTKTPVAKSKAQKKGAPKDGGLRQKPKAAKTTVAKTTLKTRSSSRPVTRRLEHEKQSKAQKKGAPKDGVQQKLPTDIKFGALDGNPVRFTNLEAWGLVNGAWRPVPPGEVLSNAAVMREVRFKELFPQAPLLPKKAFHSGKR
jgi:Phasin protein